MVATRESGQSFEHRVATDNRGQHVGTSGGRKRKVKFLAVA